MDTADASDSLSASAHHGRSTEGETRHHIMLKLLTRGPISAAELGQQLGITPAGIRRHLDILVASGLAEVAPRRTSKSTVRGRGRPAKAFQLTDEGRASFGHQYDHLAAAALATLRECGGDEAVREFARKRVAHITAGIAPADHTKESAYETVRELAQAFANNGYATEMKSAGGGVQICQHHCPIAHVASEFPELCEAESEAVAHLLGQHVQQLATLTDGHGICTTNIPLTPINHPR